MKSRKGADWSPNDLAGGGDQSRHADLKLANHYTIKQLISHWRHTIHQRVCRLTNLVSTFPQGSPFLCPGPLPIATSYILARIIYLFEPWVLWAPIWPSSSRVLSLKNNLEGRVNFGFYLPYSQLPQVSFTPRIVTTNSWSYISHIHVPKIVPSVSLLHQSTATRHDSRRGQQPAGEPYTFHSLLWCYIKLYDNAAPTIGVFISTYIMNLEGNSRRTMVYRRCKDQRPTSAINVNSWWIVKYSWQNLKTHISAYV